MKVKLTAPVSDLLAEKTYDLVEKGYKKGKLVGTLGALSVALIVKPTGELVGLVPLTVEKTSNFVLNLLLLPFQPKRALAHGIESLASVVLRPVFTVTSTPVIMAIETAGVFCAPKETLKSNKEQVLRLGNVHKELFDNLVDPEGKPSWEPKFKKGPLEIYV